jgi:hypothetical protein
MKQDTKDLIVVTAQYVGTLVLVLGLGGLFLAGVLASLVGAA